MNKRQLLLTPKNRERLRRNSSELGIARTSYPKPQSGKQALFYNCPADVSFFGGAAGSGKSASLLLDFGKEDYVTKPGYTAVIFRKTYPELTNPGGLVDDSFRFYSGIGELTMKPLEWKFPRGGKICFRHIQHENDVYSYQGSQIARIGFDELTHFSESVFWYMFSRNRSLSGVKPQIRATMNPDADSWVAKFIEWYINPDTGYPIEDRCGVIRWFIRKHEEIIWGNSREELVEKYPEGTPKSFTFISATVYDNKLLLEANPEYVSNLEALHPVERERLLKGNWKIRYESGTVFDRSWFKPLNKIPSDWIFKGRVRFWDLAATAKEIADTKTCYSAGLLLSKYEYTTDIDGYKKKETAYIIEDLLHEQKKAGDVEMMVSSVATIDGQKTMVRWELEGGSSGKIVENKLREDVLSKHPSFNVRAIKPMGDKLTRCLPAAQSANQGRVYFLIDNTWNNKFLNAVQSFDGSRKVGINDIVDSFSGAFNTLINECNYQVPESGMSTVKMGDSRMRPARRYR